MTETLKHALLIAMLCAASGAARAANSPLASADDYDFVTLVSTNMVSGKVMAETADYATMRYEDVAFLTEAFAERYALTQSFASFETFTNYVARTKSNNVVKVEIAAVPTFSFNPLSFLAPTNTPISEPVMIDSLTNVTFAYTYENRDRVGDYFTVTNVIVQTMTNGTLNAFTNLWNGGNYIQSNRYSIVTNTYNRGDSRYCFENQREVPLQEEVYIPGYHVADYYRYYPFYNIAYFTNLYNVAKHMNRALVSPSVVATNVNAASYSHEEAYYSDGTRFIRVSTNYVVRNVETYKVSNYKRKMFGEPYEDSATYYSPIEWSQTYSTGWPLQADTWHAESSRFKSVEAFAKIALVYYFTDYDANQSTNRAVNFMAPITSEFTSFPSTNGMRCVKCTLTENDIKSMAESAGITVPVYKAFTHENYTESLSASWQKTYLLFKYHPKTSLPTWQNENNNDEAQ